MGNQAEVVRRPEAWRDESVPVVSRIAFVSGGMGGIGTAICRRLGRAGHTVVAGCLPGYERKHQWLDQMRAEGWRVHAAEGDVSEFESCAEMFYNVRSVVGPIDILVNNAGISFPATLSETPMKRWDLVMNVNLRGPVLCTKAFLPQMMEQGSGRIINISSYLAEAFLQGMLSYSVSKIALERLTQGLAIELQPYGIAVNALRIEVFIASEGWMLRNPDLDYSTWEKPEAAAEAVAWLASREPGYTGQVVTIAQVRQEMRRSP